MKTGIQRRHSSEKSVPGLTNAPQLAILSWKKAVKGSSTLIADAQRGAGWWKVSGRGSGSRPGAPSLSAGRGRRCSGSAVSGMSHICMPRGRSRRLRRGSVRHTIVPESAMTDTAIPGRTGKSVLSGIFSVQKGTVSCGTETLRGILFYIK